MRLSRIFVPLLLAGLAAVSCNSANSGTIESAPPTTATSTEWWGTIEVVVDTSRNQCMDKLSAEPGGCYLRLYSRSTSDEPSVQVNSAPNTKCTAEDKRQCWPQPGTELTVLCQENGQEVQDGEGMKSSAWYAVIVPPEELFVDRPLVASTTADEVVGFASSIWLRHLTQHDPPPCKGMIAYG